MEQPPGSSEDLQPEDVTTSNISTVIDLTRKTTALNALRMVKSPGWYPNSRTTDPGLQFSETGSSDILLQSGDQIQPDNAFSHTTVTLSYVSRSHVFSTHDSLSQRPPLYSVPAISKFSLHPHCDTDNGLVCALTQHDLEHAEEPMNLTTQQTEHFLSSGPESVVAGCGKQDPLGFNGERVSCDEYVEHPIRDQNLPQENSSALENGQLDRQTSSGECTNSSPDTRVNEDGEKPEVLVKNQHSVVVSDGAGVRDLCSQSRDYRSPLEDPVSPSATSLDGVEDVFVLPQASSSPSAVNSFLETPDMMCDASSTERTASDENKPRTHRRKTLLEPLIDLTDGVVENEQSNGVPHMNGNAKALERTLKQRKLPVRSSRGTRLEAIVMNINSSRYNVSGCVLTNKTASASESTTHDSSFATPKRNDGMSVRKRRGTVQSKAIKVNKKGKSCNANTDSCKDTTSDSELKTRKKHNSIPPKSSRSASAKKEVVHLPQIVKSKRKPSSQSSPPFALCKNSKKEPELLVQPEPSVEVHVSRFSPSSPSTSPKKSQGQTKTKSPASKASPTAKTKAASAPKRRRKKQKPSQLPSMFSPKEPEIKLKYVNFKEEKRDQRLDTFSPFIHVERRQALPSCCTVVNYPEEVKMPHKKQQQAHSSSFISNVVPSTSCLQLGRASTHSQHQRALVCCLCGQSANAIDLGDLHGPYYPEGYRPSTKTPTSSSGLKEDDYSDSDSSSYSMRGRGRKCALPPTAWALRPGAQLKQKGLMGTRRWTGNGTSSPAAKRVRSDAGPEDVEDWYSPPVLPLEPCEYWLHEDCGIWSAGVFLVKGKVYGLKEAVKVAQETMCSACHNPGATLGCFFKGCPNKYHYRCALDSDCVLIEENFSMKCKKHKNKTIKAPPGSRWDDR
ncbi:retinoic acid-induced protein 1 isoform X2 [Melanotaenia boesemani]|nr:retinoic acid-induced protein 1 isoform X2 [Melanotaenia boesemani]XP_041830351.1 retinoic acid-induced protein 1 isoform X2 [Melanotaenia boesemani]